MAAYSARELRRTFKRKCHADVRMGDHIYLYFAVDGEVRAWTKLSHGNPDYGDRLLAAVARQLHLRSAELRRLIECSLGREAFERILRERAP